ncbi:MAG: hypothetical protein NAG76_20135 [Candidatus Pristimantibacillus lignocellulolyticus]|uniref:Uncharacterized protein n=1 Tax=Candidatus Pristimantibacillus lignocellulolyticus TaxID=2994561 RepID=A0A9J6ZD82_9BACL|nr:MAG: hypothetical protein NAG76_20135 [Candidatus Pristimantibacillus lignocellulolyticus]
MNLSDMLSYADITQLTRIASVYGCECNGNSKHELIQSILATVHRRDVIKEKLAKMELEELRFVNYLLFETRKSYSLEDLLARVQQCRFPALNEVQNTNTSVAEEKKKKVKPKKATKQQVIELTPREIIAKFKQQGWLFNGYAGNDRYLFHVPQDLKERFKITLAEVLSVAIERGTQPSIYREEGGQLLLDLKVMLNYIATYKPNVALDGTMHRRFVIQLNELFAIQEEMPGKGAWKFGYGKGFGEYPDRMAFMYDYCFSKGWLCIDGDTVDITKTGEIAKDSIGNQEMQSIISHWLKLYKGAIPNINSLYYWICSLSKDWTTIKSFEAVLEPYIKPYYFDSAGAILHKRIVKMLLHFGLIAIGESEQGIVIKRSVFGYKMVESLQTGNNKH